MNDSLKEENARRHLQRRVKELHTHSYLTLLSIGQAVSFHLLAAEISARRECMFVALGSHFPWMPWILSLQTFILLILVWNDFFMVISAYTWIPSLQDATILFSLFACEVFMAKSIMNVEYWLISLIFFLLFSNLAFANTITQSRKKEENMILLQKHLKRIKVSMKMIFALMCCLVIVLIVGNSYPQVYWVGVFLAAGTEFSFILNTTKSWNNTKRFIEGKLNVNEVSAPSVSSP
jgi:hypothetical protein